MKTIFSVSPTSPHRTGPTRPRYCSSGGLAFSRFEFRIDVLMVNDLLVYAADLVWAGFHVIVLEDILGYVPDRLKSKIILDRGRKTNSYDSSTRTGVHE